MAQRRLTYYDILGVPPTATTEQIRRAYRQLAAQLHPDTNADPAAHQRFVWVNAAHAVLSDHAQRQAYDASLLANALPAVILAAQQAGQRQAAKPKARPRRTWWREHGGTLVLLIAVILLFTGFRVGSHYFIAPVAHMDLSYRGLDEWPAAITGSHVVQQLDLSHNALHTLPPEVATLPNLVLLKLDHNALTALPDAVYAILPLSGLHAAHNQLSYISPRIAGLRQLRILNLAHNRLTTLPEALATLPELMRIDVRDNPIPPAEVARIRKWLPAKVQLVY